MDDVTETLLLVLVVVTALAFDFTNGFHDTGNAMATSIATKALKPKTAVALSAVLNMVGAFLSLAVAATIAKGLVDADVITLEVVLAGLVGGITWNLLTWLLGIPSSSSHALIDGVVGSELAAVGTHGSGGALDRDLRIDVHEAVGLALGRERQRRVIGLGTQRRGELRAGTTIGEVEIRHQRQPVGRAGEVIALVADRLLHVVEAQHTVLGYGGGRLPAG